MTHAVRSRRSALSLLMALLIALTLAVLPSPKADAAVRPVITAAGTGVGPLRPTVITLHGRNLKGATRVEFGSRQGTIVRRVSATTVQVRTPRLARGETVTVRIRTAKGWSARTARYTFVPVPALASLSPRSGVYAGGTSVTLRGRNLSRATKVLFGTSPGKIIKRSAARLVVKAPVGVLGAVPVKVMTPGGASRGLSYAFVRPSPKASHRLAAKAGTYVADRVTWVTRRPEGAARSSDLWVVGLPADAEPPSVGGSLLVKPGTTAFPSGLAGTVSSVAVQGDDSLRVTVRPTPINSSIDHLRIDYSGAPELSNSTNEGRRRIGLGEVLSFPLDASALFCHSPGGQTVGFGSDLKLEISDVDVSHRLDMGSLVRRPSLDASFTAEVKVVGEIHVEAKSTCSTSSEWEDLHRRPIPLGPTGSTISIAPTFEFSVTGKGTLVMTQRVRTTWSLSTTLGKTPTVQRASRVVESKLGGALSFGATVAGGVSVQFGELDRVGVETKVMLGLSVELTAEGSQVCVTAALGLNLTVGLYLDLYVERWESPTLSYHIDLVKNLVQSCLPSDDDPPAVGEPQIISGRLADATIGTAYDARLATADNREGHWSVVGSSLPAGLNLDGDNGEINGTPTGPVGDVAVVVDFADGAGRVATTIIRIMVLPTAGIGGGDIQATLTWSGPADLDLHMVDPSGEEVYYRNRTSASGGELDQDANAGCNESGGDHPVENIFWPPHGAPDGAYDTFVKVYNSCDGPLDWYLIVRRNGVVIIEQTGSGDSPDYGFTVGSRLNQRLAGHRMPARSYPSK